MKADGRDPPSKESFGSLPRSLGLLELCGANAQPKAPRHKGSISGTWPGPMKLGGEGALPWAARRSDEAASLLDPGPRPPARPPAWVPQCSHVKALAGPGALTSGTRRVTFATGPSSLPRAPPAWPLRCREPGLGGLRAGPAGGRAALSGQPPMARGKQQTSAALPASRAAAQKGRVGWGGGGGLDTHARQAAGGGARKAHSASHLPPCPALLSGLLESGQLPKSIGAAGTWSQKPSLQRLPPSVCSAEGS